MAEESGSFGPGAVPAATAVAVSLHDGRVRVQSEEGQGATFIVELPLNKL